MKVIRIRLDLILLFSAVFFLVVTTAHALDINVTGAAGVQGETVTVSIEVPNAPNDVESLRFNLNYDTTKLEYIGFTRGNLTAGFNFFDVGTTTPGLLISGGIGLNEGKILTASSGILVNFNFKLIGNVGECDTLVINALTDGISGWIPANGNVCIEKTCNYAITSVEQPVLCQGGNFCISVTTGDECSWTSSADTGWITINPPSFGVGNGDICYSVEENPTTAIRTGIVTIAGLEHRVTQAPGQCITECNIQPDSLNVSPNTPGTTFTVPIRVLNAPNNFAVFRLTVNYDTNALEYVDFTRGVLIANYDFFDVGASTPGMLLAGGFEASAADIIPAGANGVVVNLTFRLLTALGPCTTLITSDTVDDMEKWTTCSGKICTSCNYDITPAKRDVYCQGGEYCAAVATREDCEGNAKSNVEWITIIKGTPMVGSGDLCYRVEPNSGTAARTGTITIADNTHTVAQSQCVCGGEMGDVNGDGQITPADALCIFRKYLKMPSCLD